MLRKRRGSQLNLPETYTMNMNMNATRPATATAYLPAPYLYLPRIAARVRRIGLDATVRYYKNRGFPLEQALYLFAGRSL